jgi:putative membrane protein
MSKRTLAWLVGTCLLLGAPAAGAADDAEFVKKAASGGKLEVQLGRHVAQHASNPDVRAFGERMVKDHGAANQQLEDVARKAGLTLPSEMEEKHRQMVEKLTALRGEELDRAYMKEMVEDHEHDVADFRKQADQAESEVDRWAARTLPTLESHLAQAEKISKQIDASAEMPRGQTGARGAY